MSSHTEYAGFDCDFERKFPAAAHRAFFIKSYLNASIPDSTEKSASELGDFIVGFDRVILQHVLLSHLFWGNWALVQAGLVADSDFNFMSYASKRIQAFFIQKREFEGWLEK